MRHAPDAVLADEDVGREQDAGVEMFFAEDDRRVAMEREERIERGLVVRTRETRRLWPQGGDAEPSLTIISGGELSLTVK